MSLEPFDYYRAKGLADAVSRLTRPGALAIAGGTDVLPLWRVGGVTFDCAVDLSHLDEAAVRAEPERLVMGALARLNDVAGDSHVRERWPLIAQALDATASPQIRNLATVGGNLLQRTRCSYFRSADLPCNRRQPGSGCGARDGVHRMAAIFGTSAHCIATHASDLAVALVALEAALAIVGPDGERCIPVVQLWMLPGERPHVETVLRPGEVIRSIIVPAAPPSTCRYRKVRDRASFEFAVTSVAVALSIKDGCITQARLAAGGVGTVPWRLRSSELALLGQRANPQTFQAAARLAGDGAAPLRDNVFKVELLRRTVEQSLEEAYA